MFDGFALLYATAKSLQLNVIFTYYTLLPLASGLLSPSFLFSLLSSFGVFILETISSECTAISFDASSGYALLGDLGLSHGDIILITSFSIGF